MKTLDQIEPRTPISSLPYTITSSGSYYVTTNLTGIAGTNGITIKADKVTVDLMGFTLTGVPGSLSGVAAPGVVNIAVLNGNVSGWGGAGVDLGSYTRLKDLRAYLNNGIGLAVGSSCTIINCLSELNSAGIRAGNSCVVKDCVAYFNSGLGIGQTGIGIDCRDNAAVSSCVVSYSSRTEISVGSMSLVRDCVATSQGENGILVTNRCQVLNNNCVGNGAGSVSAIHATGTGNRIEGNLVNFAAIGIRVDGTNNLTIRNSASGNVNNYSIAAGNITGTIVTSEAAMNSAANANVNISF